MRTISSWKFEWDPVKNAGNAAKHGLSLAAATALWSGPVVTLPSKNPGEPRQLALGLIDGRHWTVIVAFRGDRCRLISARRSRADEKKIYQSLAG
ncbi:MAG: BrnT family toxin [Opitutales bacterium]